MPIYEQHAMAARAHREIGVDYLFSIKTAQDLLRLGFTFSLASD